ncbi:MAG: HTTM domain-containing protein [Kofleriaceae bacterium]
MSPLPPFWAEFAVSPAKLRAVRVAFFTLVAIDCVLAVGHAPRYGAGGFNVAHLPGLDGLAPGRVAMGVASLVTAYACVLAALGVATRVVVPVAAALYGWIYFSSQLDSYQHHYLIALLLVLACAVPWTATAPPPPARGTPPPPRIASWALRLVLVQLALVYAWAAISKLDGHWLDGSALAEQIKTGRAHDLITATIGMKAAAIGVVLVELALAATLWHRRGWWVALPLGVGLHAGIAITDLEIGLFAYLMLALYLLVVPDSLYDALARRWPWRGRTFAAPPTAVGLGAVALAIVVGVALTARADLPDAWLALVLAAPLSAVALVGAWRARPRALVRVAVAHVAALGLWLVVDAASATSIDYYRFWGGSSARLGDPVTAARAYQAVLDIDASNGNAHYQLAKLAQRRGDLVDAEAHLRRAVALEPARARARVLLATLLAGRGEAAAARTLVEEALALEPGHRAALSLQAQLRRAGGAPAPTAPAEDDE